MSCNAIEDSGVALLVLGLYTENATQFDGKQEKDLMGSHSNNDSQEEAC